jgi:hypothetical protein
MARGLTPEQRVAHDALRMLVVEVLARYPTVPLGVIADAVGVKQSTITNALKGRQTSVVTLAMIARVIMPMVSAEDERRLQNVLTLVEPFMRKPRPNAAYDALGAALAHARRGWE